MVVVEVQNYLDIQATPNLFFEKEGKLGILISIYVFWIDFFQHEYSNFKATFWLFHSWNHIL